MQQGGDPSPFDRIQSTRFAQLCLEYLIEQCNKGMKDGAFVGLQGGQYKFHDMLDFTRMIDVEFQRPKYQWWLELKPVAATMAKLNPET
jgi:6-phosphofructokinase 1